MSRQYAPTTARPRPLPRSCPAELPDGGRAAAWELTTWKGHSLATGCEIDGGFFTFPASPWQFIQSNVFGQGWTVFLLTLATTSGTFHRQPFLAIVPLNIP